jgi:predicted transglutaminase-like cysteine proteinase
MGIFSYSRTLGVAVMAWGMVSFGPASDLAAGTQLSPGHADLDRKSAEPFGVFAFRLSGGGLWEIWLAVQRKLDDELVQLALCDGDRERCVSPAALRFLAIVDNAKAREGRARLGEINRAINLAIHPMSDLAQYGEIDVWSSPLLTFTTGSGDCEDYAIAKFVALRRAGIPPEDLRIVIMHDTIRGENHAVAAARLDGHWLTLDNRHMTMVEDAHIRNYRPLYVIDQYGVMQYADALVLAVAPDQRRGAYPILLLLRSPTAAQDHLALCNGTDRTPPELQINGCTAIIDLGEQTPAATITYDNRGDAYSGKGTTP